MKKISLFLFSTLIATAIAVYSKKNPPVSFSGKAAWKTFEKKNQKEITSHKTSGKELEAARIPNPKRELAQIQIKDENIGSPDLPKDRVYQLRENRLLLGDIQRADYQDEDTELDMVNKINPDWKTILGNDLLRFQEAETKVLIKDEIPVIKIQNGKGQYLEQVVVTYVFKNGNVSSFHAMVDSETGFVTDTWDRTIHEKSKPQRAELTLPAVNNSGIKAR